MNVTIHLPYYGVELRTERPVFMSDTPAIKRSVQVYHNRLNLIMFDFEFDERDNTFKSKSTSSISEKLQNDFNELKKTNIKYGNIGSGNEYEYEAIEHIYLEDFFDYLKSKNRELTINQLFN
jgi:hypothetical protein